MSAQRLTMLGVGLILFVGINRTVMKLTDFCLMTKILKAAGAR